MRFLRIAVLVASVFSLTGCGHLFMYMMGARGHAVPASQVESIYYKTSPDLKTAYVFYSIPGRIATGMSTSYGTIDGGRGITIEFGAVRDNPRNRDKYGEGIYSHYKIGDEWVAEFDIGDNDAGKPHQDQIKIFYTLERRERNEPIPYRGVWQRLKNKAEQGAGGIGGQAH